MMATWLSFPRSAWERTLATLRVASSPHPAERVGPQSGRACVPTRSVGTRKSRCPGLFRGRPPFLCSPGLTAGSSISQVAVHGLNLSYSYHQKATMPLEGGESPPTAFTLMLFDRSAGQRCPITFGCRYSGGGQTYFPGGFFLSLPLESPFVTLGP